MIVRRVVAVQLIVGMGALVVVHMGMSMGVRVGHHRAVGLDVAVLVGMGVHMWSVRRVAMNTARCLRMRAVVMRAVGVAMMVMVVGVMVVAGMAMVAVIVAAPTGRAMLVIMIVGVMMIVVVTGPMGMTGVVMVMVMVMVMPVSVAFLLRETVVMVVAAALIVGPALRPERTHDRLYPAAEPAHHVGKDVVVLYEDRRRCDFGRRVAVADVPGDTGQRQRIVRRHLQQPLLRRPHRHQTVVFQHQRIAVVQHSRLAEIEQERQASVACQHHPPPVTPGMVKGHAVGDADGFSRALAQNGNGSQHGHSAFFKSRQERRGGRGPRIGRDNAQNRK